MNSEEILKMAMGFGWDVKKGKAMACLGDIIMLWEDGKLFSYINKQKILIYSGNDEKVLKQMLDIRIPYVEERKIDFDNLEFDEDENGSEEYFWFNVF